MRSRGWTVIAWSTVTVAMVAWVLLSRRVEGLTLAATVIPLIIWSVTTTRIVPGWPVALLQFAIVLVVAAGAGGYLGLGAWAASYPDSAIVYALLALGGCLELARAGRDYPRLWPRRPGWARLLSRVGDVAIPVALVAGCCLGAFALEPATPPPPGLVTPLPGGIQVDDERLSCAAGPSGGCTWSITVSDPARSVLAMRAELADHFEARGWPAGLPGRQCRTWGLVIRERVCLSLQVREAGSVLIPGGPDRIIASARPLGWPVIPMGRRIQLTIVVTYW
jgi:hypothetical protein